MIFLNLPDDKLGVENRWREVVEKKGNNLNGSNNNKSFTKNL